MSEERLYIKVVLPKQAAERKKQGGGGKAKPFKDVTKEVRDALLSGIAGADQQLTQTGMRRPVVPLRVDLEREALAKSHWKDELFSPQSSPVFGAGRPGELFVQASASGLSELRRKLESGRTAQVEKEISAIREIRPVRERDRLQGKSPEDLISKAPSVRGKHPLKIKLFTFEGDLHDEDAASAFESIAQRHNLSVLRLPQYKGQRVYSVQCTSAEDVQFLAQIPQVRSVGLIPQFKPVKAAQTNRRKAPSWLERTPDQTGNAPIVAVVDSGVTSQIKTFDPWVYGREKFVATSEANKVHGTFVAGLIVWGHVLNPDVPEITHHPCRILDVQVLPNTDPSVGQVGYISEAELLQDLEQCLVRHSNEVKVWNLSLGTDEVCSLDTFSDFAIQLDNLQERFGVTFVIAAGNYQVSPLLSYPRTEEDLSQGRITSPADSVLGITVGSISQISHPSSGSKRGEPSPFSRHGPGPNYIIKPDLAHFGGNIGTDFSYPLGVTSLTVEPGVADDIGTSFAAPLISRQLAHVHHRITPAPSPTLAKAILTHNARDVRTKERVSDGEDHFVGFGTPLDVDRALECTPWMITLVFDEVLRPGFFLEWDNFPYPESLLANGKYRGEIWMTLAYPPARNPSWGSEYCETHVEAHFGVVRDGKKGEEFKGQVPLEHSNPGQLWEEVQVRSLRKWAPVRTYHNVLPLGVSGKRWRLYVELLCRHKVEDSKVSNQPFALLLTIADPERNAPVYDEMSRNLRTRFQTRDLALRQSVRLNA